MKFNPVKQVTNYVSEKATSASDSLGLKEVGDDIVENSVLSTTDDKLKQFDDYLKTKEDELLAIGVAAVGVTLIVMTGGAAAPIAAAGIGGGAALIGTGASMYGANKSADDQARDARKAKNEYESNTYVYGTNLKGESVDGYNDIDWSAPYDSMTQVSPSGASGTGDIGNVSRYNGRSSTPSASPSASMRPQSTPSSSQQMTRQTLSQRARQDPNGPISADDMQRGAV